MFLRILYIFNKHISLLYYIIFKINYSYVSYVKHIYRIDNNNNNKHANGMQLVNDFYEKTVTETLYGDGLIGFSCCILTFYLFPLNLCLGNLIHKNIHHKRINRQIQKLYVNLYSVHCFLVKNNTNYSTKLPSQINFEDTRGK